MSFVNVQMEQKDDLDWRVSGTNAMLKWSEYISGSRTSQDNFFNNEWREKEDS